MKDIRLIARADDLGSSRSANIAIASAIGGGYIKNVSAMACGPFISEAAELIAGRKDVAFGMHTSLNAEWDRVKWGSVSGLEASSGLVDENGSFLAHPSMFLQTRPALETVMKEVSAQLDRLCALGFNIEYLDSHMFIEGFIPGLDEALYDFCEKKGLVCHMSFYNLIEGQLYWTREGIASAESGQYFTLNHPSLYTEEMLLTGTDAVSGEEIASGRAAETKVLTDPSLHAFLKENGIRTVKYTEAVPGPRLTARELMELLDI